VYAPVDGLIPEIQCSTNACNNTKQLYHLRGAEDH